MTTGYQPNEFEFGSDDDGEFVRIMARGHQVLSSPGINQGSAFSLDDRTALGLNGLLPSGVTTLSGQLKRVYAQYQAQPDALSKYLYLNAMHDRNEVLYFALLTEHIEEMMPIVYTPTIGQAIEEYSHWYQRPRGVFLSIDNPDKVEEALGAMGHRAEDVDLIVVTDSEGILGIGDQGVGGIAITVGKLAVYTAAAGIHPHRVLPVVLDTGTDNLELLNDESYLGARHARVRGERYDDFIERFVTTAHKLFPNALIHWEDFGAGNATRILAKYHSDYCTFNDDIQGTAAVVAAAVMAAVRASGVPLPEQRIVVHGAGSAGIGIASLLRRIMIQQGVDADEARSHVWGLGSRGLLREGLTLRDFQRAWARPSSELEGWTLDRAGHYELADVVRNVRPTILIGCSAQAGAFSEEIVRQMAADCDRPIIMPLSNPTRKAEAVPSDLLEWTGGRALIATGSPFEPVRYQGTTYRIAQANNALVFPGIGLGAITSRASRVSEGMIAAAATALARTVNARNLGASLLPDMTALRSISARVALAVVESAQNQELATVELVANPVQAIYDAMWQPRYPRIIAA
ncbi:NAD-dependent malic enzyme [Acidipropionibacterium acidipropionici ATCC 4875]|uniref:Putative malate oxidoreductase [NAD] n=1 Tax=Acidipropionibacterium acidipropionici (strain ATCC 4875 / DSM 20272 / JCM 6432 / NBRC 12425 / NCIMB 8070 / 4) TaxID=1171373 RepID=K7SFJ5_ACIA4|nr:NAD-dependent malic enzyme [Acidipropionibacterium acidipropionici]AFV88060.1 NAD-dependent malic enzyme [Acidipropionibacterium acidipropionici ATCC 4875]ALN14574.1 NAD-dependent malic enzyme [Acidipropionibacterium acidipropionici]APZ09668.1 NAD-dependent malic enzyme [Acidipropionibacterium acidipropionici]